MGRVRIEQFRMQFQDARSNTELSGIYSNHEQSPCRWLTNMSMCARNGQKPEVDCIEVLRSARAAGYGDLTLLRECQKDG